MHSLKLFTLYSVKGYKMQAQSWNLWSNWFLKKEWGGLTVLTAVSIQQIKLNPQYQQSMFSRKRRWEVKNGNEFINALKLLLGVLFRRTVSGWECSSWGLEQMYTLYTARFCVLSPKVFPATQPSLKYESRVPKSLLCFVPRANH